MVKWRYYKSALAVMVIALSLAPLAGAGSGLAQDPGGPQGQPGLPTIPNPRPIPGRSEAGVLPGAELATFQEHGPANIIIQLEETPVAMIMGDGQAQGAVVRDQIARIEAAQSSVLDAMTAQGIPYTLMGKTSRVLSSVIVRADASHLEAIRALPGVTQAYVERIGHYDNSSTVPYIQTPSAWVEGYTGAGMRVGLIDSGIDYDHLDFGGNGDQIPDIGPGLDYPSAKVAEGYDFVGDGWMPGDPLSFDDDPYDEFGHGTHVAGTLAGYGVLSGSTYPGPWDNTTPFSTMTVGPGVAPEAVIYPLKVGGPSDDVSEAATLLALEFAADPNYDEDTSDHLDVVNMAFGSNFGDPDSGWATAVNNAALLGIVVVAPAGNSGDTYFIQGIPGTADRALSVGASFDGINADHLASFSSRGPQIATTGPAVGLKPDITAPGGEVTSAALGTGSAATTMGGTSMASAHVAGAVTLLRQQHPTWSVAEIKALAMNSAIHLLTNGSDYYATGRVGAGRLDVSAAIDSDVIAYNTTNPELVGVSWGVQDADTSSNQLKTITVENKGTVEAVLDVTYDSLADVPGVSFTVSPPSVTIPPGGTQTVNVTLNIDPAAMTVNPHTHAPTVIETQYGDPRHWLSEESGLVHLARVSGPVPELLWVPVYAAVRPASTLQSTVNPISMAGITGSMMIDMTGTAVDTGTDVPYDIVSKVSAFDLVIESTDDLSAGAEGVYNGADIEYVGITSDYNAVVGGGGTFSANGKVYFGISTYGQWSSLSDTVWFEVFIDSNQDGTFDYKVYNWNNGSPFGNSPSDSLVVIVKNLSTMQDFLYPDMWVNHYPAVETATSGGAFDTGLDTAVFQNRVMFMGMWANLIGLSDADADFDYYVRSNYGSAVVETTAVKSYDASVQGLDFSGGNPGAPLHTDAAGPSVPVSWDWSIYQGSDPPCALLLHHHNVDALRAEKVCFNPNITADISVEKTTTTLEARRGYTVEYDLTVHNSGPDIAGSVVLVDDLPDSLIYVSAVPTTGSCGETSGYVECDLGDFSSGQTESVTLTVTVGVSTPGPLNNTASVSFNGYDPNSADNSSTATFTYVQTFCDPVTEIPLYECDALEAFYNDTNGPNWTNKSGWVTTTTPCSWYGVSCAAGHVTSLNLSNNALSGPIPTVLDDLDNLIILDLSQNTLTGAMPSAIVGMTNLQYLYLNGNQINDLPVELPTMSGLLRLRLNTNLLIGNDILVDLTAMTNLTELDLGNNALGGTIPATLSNMTALRTLKLNDTGLSGAFPTEVSSLTYLQSLDLSGNQFAGPIPSLIGGLTSLQSLVLSDNQFDGTLPTEIGNLVSLNTLKLRNNALGNDVPSTITNLTSLVYNQLDLGYNMLTAPSTAVRSFLNTKDPDWLLTQTVRPTNAALGTVAATSVALSWTPIYYTGDGGYYQVGVSQVPGGPYASGCTTADKTASGCVVEGLIPETPYYFVVQTFTPAHGDQQNDLWSPYTSELGATTKPEVPPDTNLVRNGDFAAGTSEWLVWGGASASVNAEVMELTNTGAGSLFQDAGAAAPNGAPFEMLVDLGNSSAAPKDVQLLLHNPELTDVLSCQFSLPGGAGLQTYIMRGVTAMAWSDVRLEVVPLTYDGLPALLVDNIDVQYKPSLSLGGVECFGPDMPPNLNIARNGDFSSGESQWNFYDMVGHSVTGGVLTFWDDDTSNGVWQDTYYSLPTDAPVTASVELGNSSAAAKEVMVVLHDHDWSGSMMCYFALPAGAPLATYTLQGPTTVVWDKAMIAIWDLTGNGLAGIQMDNVDVQYQPSLSLSGVTCGIPEMPANLNVARNGAFASGETSWNAYDMLGHAVSGGVLTFWDDDTSNGMWQDTFYRLPAGAPMTASVDLGNSSSAAKEVMVVLHDQDWSGSMMCYFALPAGAPLATYGLQGPTIDAWDQVMIAVWDLTGNGLEGIRMDNVDVQYQPSLSLSGVECLAADAPADVNLTRNSDFANGESQWNAFDLLGHGVSGGVLTFWDDDTTNGMWQDTFYRLPAGAPMSASVELGNSSSAAREVMLVLHDQDWSESLMCYFALPAGAPLTTYTMQGPTTVPWDQTLVAAWDLTANGLEGIQMDNVDVRYQPSLSLSGLTCGVSDAPANLNLVRNSDFSNGETSWNFFDMIGHSVTGGVLTFWDDDASNSAWQDIFYSLPSGAPMSATLDLGNSSSAAKEVMVVLHDEDWSGSMMCGFILPAGAPLTTYTLQGPTTAAWDRAMVALWDLTGDGLEGIQVDNVDVQYQPSLSLTGVECSVSDAPANVNLVRNGDFASGEMSWNFYDMLGHNVTGGVLTFWDDDTSNGVWQDTYSRLPASAPMNASVELGNSSSAGKEVMVVLHDKDWSESLMCYFALPAGAPLATYTLQGPTTAAWDDAMVAVWDLTGNSLEGIQLDNVDVQYQPSLSLSGVTCGIPAMPADLNVARNGDFSNGETSWNAYDMLGHNVSSGVLTFWDDDTTNGMWQDTFYSLPSGAPMNASVELGNSSAAGKEVMLVLHDEDWSDSLMCYFALPAGAPLATYSLQGPTADVWDKAMIAVWDLTGNGLQGIRMDNVDVQYQPSLSLSGVTCGVPEVPANVNLARNGDFASGETSWNFFDMLSHSVAGGVLTFWDDDTSNSVWQNTFYSLPASAPMTVSVDLGNSSADAKGVTIALHDEDWSDSLMCYVALPAGAPLATYTLRGPTADVWDKAVLDVWDLTGNSLEGIQMDNVDVQYQPSLSLSGVECFVPAMPANLNVARNGTFANGESQWNYFDMLNHSVSGGVLTFWDDDTSNSVWQNTFYGLLSGAPMTVLLDLGNTSSAAKDIAVVLHVQDWSQSMRCDFTLPAGASLGTYSLQGPTTAAWANVVLDVWDLTGDNLEGIQLDNVDVQYQPSLSLSGVTCDIPATGPGGTDLSPAIDDPVVDPQIDTMTVIEAESSSVTRTGTWTPYSSASASGGAYVYSSGSVDDTLSLGFGGTSVIVRYVTHPALGRFNIEVDGNVLRTVNASLDAAVGVDAVITGLASGAHTLRIVPTDGAIAVDAFLVELADETVIAPTPDVTPTPTATPQDPASPTPAPDNPPVTPAPFDGLLELVESDDARVAQTGAWSAHQTELASGGAYLFSSGAPGDSLSLTFAGIRLEVIYVQHPALGRFAIEVDDQVQLEVDAYHAETVFGVRAALDLPPGEHRVRVVALDGTIALDAFAVPLQALLTPTPTAGPQDPASPTPTLTPLPDDPGATPTVTPAAPTDEPTAAPPSATPTSTATLVPGLLPVIDACESPVGWSAQGAWQIVPAGYQGGAWLADAAQRATSSTLTFNLPLDLRGTTAPVLTFWQRVALAPGDLALVELSIDGGATWSVLDQQAGLTADWVLRSVDLATFRETVVLLRFSLHTGQDPNPLALGWWVDQVLIEDVPPPVPTSTPLPTATLEPIATPTNTPPPTATPEPSVPPTSTPPPTATPAPGGVSKAGD